MDDARSVAGRIGIRFHVLDYREFFEKTVIDYFCRAYLRGETPNPCIECNRVVKFGRLLELADSFGADCVATGHYARVTRDVRTARYLLKKGTDAGKDQSYFLYSLRQEQLSRALFPLGEVTKEETRRLAESLGLGVSDKPASQDVCFLAGGSYRAFLAERFPESLEPGPIVDPSGRLLGRHRGIAFYTVGQRRGLGVAAGEPLYVLDVDKATRTVTAGSRDDLRKSRISVKHVNWIAFERPPERLEVDVRLRYRHRALRATVSPAGDGRVVVSFATGGTTAAPGQSAVFYDGDVVVGGGIIERVPTWPPSPRWLLP